MASLQACYSLHHNLSLSSKYELARRVSTKDNNIYILTLATLRTPTITPVPTLPNNNELFQQFIKTQLKNKNQVPLPILI